MAQYQTERYQCQRQERSWNRHPAVENHRVAKRDKIRMKDPAHRIKFMARKRVRQFLQQRGYNKEVSSISKWVGCSSRQLRNHIEAQFRDGMTWDNRGTVWELDHITPLASVATINKENMARLSHWTNLQALLKWENRAKGDGFEFGSRSGGPSVR